MKSYKGYWATWFVLLLLTLGMIAVGELGIPAKAIVVLLLLGMVVKITLIGGNFMHLRFERWSLILTVVIAVLFTAVMLFVGIAPDGIRSLTLSQH